MHPMLANKKVLTWGASTRDPDALGRRVFLSHIPADTTIDDVLKFFGEDGVEGVHLRNYFGFVQFKRPCDASEALKKHNSHFRGKRINVELDTRLSGKPNDWALKRSESKLAGKRDNGRKVSVSPARRHSHRGVSPPSSRRHRSRSPIRSRGRSRSQSRDRLVLHGSIRDSKQSRISFNGHRARSRSSSNDTELSSRNEPERQGPSANKCHPLANYSSEFRDLTSEQSAHVRQPLAPSHLTLVPVDLPNSIDLSLKLVMSQKTVQCLTVNQIQDIIDYFESEKATLLNTSGTFISPNGAHNLPPHKIFYSANSPAISYATNNGVPHQAHVLGPVSREPEVDSSATVQMPRDVDVRDLEETLRILRESQR